MTYRLDLNSQNFFSTSTNNSTGNRKYATDFSFLEDKKYLVRFDLQQRWSDGTIALNDNWNMSGYTYTGANLTITTRTQNNLRLTMNNQIDPTLTLAGTRPSVNPNNFKYIHLRYKVVSGAVDTFRLYYYNTTGQGLAEDKAVGFNYGSVVLGEWRNIVIDMTNVANWTLSTWNRYRLDPIVQGTAVIDFEYFVISDSPNYPYNFTDFNNLVRINLGGVCQNNIISSNNIRRTPTNFSGLLQAKKSGVNIQQYCKQEHNPPFFLNGRPSDNFVEVDLCDTDFNVSYITANYNMTLYFEEVE